MILVPFEKAVDNHQEKNARFFEKMVRQLLSQKKNSPSTKLAKP